MALSSELSAQSRHFPHGYQVSREAWERFAASALKDGGGEPASPAARVAAARKLAAVMNERRDFSRPETRPARAGELVALGLLTDVLRYVVNHYAGTINPGALHRGLEWVRSQRGHEVAEKPVKAFVELYPPGELREGRLDAESYLGGREGSLSRPEAVTRELVLLFLGVANPALAPYRELHDDRPLRTAAPYRDLVRALERFFDSEPVHPATQMSLLRTLRLPMEASPDSIEGQLAYMRSHWEALLPEGLLARLVLAQDVMREETKLRGPGPGPQEVMAFGAAGDYPEFEAFSIDKEWMPNLVLLAKTVYVWLDQLSKAYGRPITRLDQIPDEELDKIGRWGFTGLWLIGVWERSPASEEIKRRMGNPEAAASAYSLYDYTIAADLGGDAACADLARRAWKRGIRLASDMVPNHVGIYSRWVVEHPDWFVQLNEPPYPGYQFTGPDLSRDGRVGLYIEDGYWDRRDAAVVFKHVDHGSGHTRYIYHGNDGTSMPWNDTAQLNYLIPEVRAAVIETILHVARQFRVIRFDAAMTLAKKHYQRLWYPKPGDAGSVPSRVEHGMSQAEFDRVFPVEFWREVVDRVAAEAPDTLLLAEAFWLMEGYFVRTLGMHRVYNSAFMNMLKMEDNAKYRQTIKNVLEFSPEVLQRFVNFMNNPDEETAEAQFGKGDKYFGVAAMLVTMPGLPMFGHGQVEGFTEKYGMEYRRAYRDETPDSDLVARHEREIFPLMRLRHLFSGAHHFALFDLVTPDGWVNENVFAYSNRAGEDRGLFIFNNAYEGTRGVLHTSTAINTGSATDKHLRRLSLAEALDLDLAGNSYYIYRDQRGGLEYLRHARRIAEEGLHVELHGYQYYAFSRWRAVHDLDGSWGQLDALLGGKGVPSVDDAYLELHLAPILEPFRVVMNGNMLKLLADPEAEPEQREGFREAMTGFLRAVAEKLGRPSREEEIVAAIETDLERVHALPEGLARAELDDEVVTYAKTVLPYPGDGEVFRQRAAAWTVLRHVGRAARPAKEDPAAGRFDVDATSAAWLREWFLQKQVARAFEEAGLDAEQANLEARFVRICIAHRRHLLALRDEVWGPMLDAIFRDSDVLRYLLMNLFQGVRWINAEQLDRLLGNLFVGVLLDALPCNGDPIAPEQADALAYCLDDIQALRDAAEDAGYDLDRMLTSLK